MKYEFNKFDKVFCEGEIWEVERTADNTGTMKLSTLYPKGYGFIWAGEDEVLPLHIAIRERLIDKDEAEEIVMNSNKALSEEIIQPDGNEDANKGGGLPGKDGTGKDDRADGKLRWDLLPLAEIEDIVKHLRKETKGKVLFLGENVRMRDEHRWVITEELGVEPVEIDSALVSAQTRHCLYWCNWSVEMPKDKHISLDDILEHDKGWNPGAIRGRYIGTIVGRRIGEDGYRKDCGKDIKITQCLEIRKDKNTTPIKKSNCLTTVMKDNVISSLPPGRYPNAFDMKDKFRYLTPVEMCRLQTLPDDYLDGIAPNTAMSLAGNGWTVDVIAHLLRSIERKQINDIVKEFRKITDELMFGSLETDIM